MHDAYDRWGDPEGFRAYLAELRGQHRRKRAFQEELTKQGLGSV